VRRIIEELGYKPNIFAKHLKLSRTFHFGVLMPIPSQDSMYWTLPLNGINKALRSLAGQRIEIKYFFYDKYSPESIHQITRELLQTKLDGLLIAPVVSRIFEKFITEIPKDLPYVFFDSFLPRADYVSYIGQDSFQSGVLSAKLMKMIIQGKATVAALKVFPEDYHIEDRVNGFLSFCKKCSGIEVRVYDIDGNNPSHVQKKVFSSVFEENSDLKGIFVSNASTHLVAEFIKNNPLAKKVYLIGYDPIEKNKKYLKEGIIDFLISQQSEKQGYEGLMALYRRVVLNLPVEKKIMMQIDIITKENIDYYQS